MNDRIDNRAVVLGGSIAGLLAARALADAFTEVTVVDRDELCTYRTHRRGVPQARHAHALLARGQQVLEELFPGLTAELVGRGVPTGDALGDVRLHFSGHRMRQATTGLVAVSSSRACLEDRIRTRVRDLPQVRFAPPCDVVGLVTTPDSRRVTGVRVLGRAGGAEETLDADQVVDATGRGSRAPVWLEAHGFRRPHEERVKVDLGYATRRYRLPIDALGGDLASLHGPTPEHPRGGVLARLENDQWMLTLAGFLGDYPPIDPDAFIAFARSLPFPDIGEVISHADPLDEPVSFRFPASVRRRYERLSRCPEGFVPLGDSICSFNPIYGQGMTVAAVQALTLRHHVTRSGLVHPGRLLRDLCRVVDAPWGMAAGGDLALPGVDGRRTPKTRMAGAYIAKLHAAAAHDAKLATTFVRVSGLVDPPEILLRPSVALRVLRRRTATR